MLARRRKRAEPDVRDYREVVVVPGRGEMTLDYYKKYGCEPLVKALDAMPKPYRELAHEFGDGVWNYWKRGKTVAEIRALGKARGWL